MSATALTVLIARCRTLCRPRLPQADAELLRRFVQQREAAAFEELLERYAPLVWSVCRRMLPREVDCEDVFQATFLALVRKPDKIDPRQALGGWLHTVAVRIARKMQTRARRECPRAHVGRISNPSHSCTAGDVAAHVGRISNPSHSCTAGDVAEEVGSRELFRLVDEEIERLPSLLRLPLVLCCLEGRTRDEAAEALGCSVAAVKSRLERGLDLLRRSLHQRGVQLPAAFLVLGLTSERIRAASWAKTMQSAMFTPSPTVTALAEAALPSFSMMAKCKLMVAVLLLTVGTAGAIGDLLTVKPQLTPAAPMLRVPVAVAPKKLDTPPIRTDRHGDPLPAGAITRLGTVRWRHGYFISSLAYSPDGKNLAATGGGRAITLWDAATGKEIHPFPNRNQPNAVAFSPDGKILATTDTPSCHLWDAATGKELRELKGHSNGLRSVAFAPDGKTMATSSYDGTARIWETNTGKELRRLDCNQGSLYSAAYSSDGKILATGGENGTIRLWDAATGIERRQLHGHRKAIWDFAFSANGKHLASSSDDGTIRLWDPETGKQVLVLDKKQAGARAPIAFSPDGALLAFGRLDGMVCLWDMAKGEEKRRWQAGVGSVGRALAFSPDSKTLATGWDGCIRQWDVATGREKKTSDGHRGSIDLLRFSPEAKALISIGSDRRLLTWDLGVSTPRQSFSWPAQRSSVFALSASGDTLAVDGWPDAHLRLWNAYTGKPGLALGKPQKSPFWKAIAFSPDGRLVAAQGSDHAIHLWDAAGGKEVRQIQGIGERVESLIFSPDGKLLASGAGGQGVRERAVRLWDVSSGTEIRSFNGSGPIALAFSPSGKMLAAGQQGDASTRSVRLWDTATGKEMCRHSGHGEIVGAIAFSPDGKLVASGTGWTGWRDNSVHVWEAVTGRLIRRFEGHHSCVGSLAFSPDGLTAASGAGDATVLLWDITGRRSDGRWHKKPLMPKELAACWSTLSDADAAKAYDAVWQFVAAPEQAVPFLRKKLSPIARPDAKAVERGIADLDSDDFAVRQKAAEELSKLGDAIAPALRQALADKPSLEKRRRLQQLLDQTRDWTPERLRVHRAIQVLEHIGTRQAKEALRSLAAGAAETLRTA